ncbi:hypothetical protein [Haladaptatus paucihalophilus]|uniref:Uncharacterized protein n=1 Tax=Haladaptatus paucihalophilus DX253 TaxID=797209 RepID=A0A1M7BZT1_HALPU|nr:hypothetical protein [Haladaptatus paucihalophilus]SHL60481.1 hypothetical protein SAMN05444342_4229 [Haladaptatus paucihalophilus DX253]
MHVGRSSDRPPTENTLEVNVTHELLQDIRKVFKYAVAVNPTRGEEKDFGYDISIDWNWLKIFALQFKAFRTKGSIRLNGSNTKENYYKYELDKEQHSQLKYYFPHSRMAFYTLPVFPTRNDLKPPLLSSKLIYHIYSRGKLERRELPRVFFIDVHDIPAGATKISVSTDIDDLRRAVCYCKDREHHAIDHRAVFSWGKVWEGIRSCRMGVKLREDGDPTEDLHNIVSSWDQPIEDQKSADKLQKTVQISLGAKDLPEDACAWASNRE